MISKGLIIGKLQRFKGLYGGVGTARGNSRTSWDIIKCFSVTISWKYSRALNLNHHMNCLYMPAT